MSEIREFSNLENSNYSLFKYTHGNSDNHQLSEDNFLMEDYNDIFTPVCNSMNAISSNLYPTISCNFGFANDEFCNDNILEENGRISLAYENLRCIPRNVAEKYGGQIKCLDLSYNNFQNLSFLSIFDELHTLVLDHNIKLDVNSLPYLPNLKILWLNNCNILNISEWVKRIQKHCPNLEQLSIMGNPGIKNEFKYYSLTTPTINDPFIPIYNITDYRDYILNILPKLKYLDGTTQKPDTNELVDNKEKQQPTFSTTSNQSITAYNCNSTAKQKQIIANNSSHKKSLNFMKIFKLIHNRRSQGSSTS